MNGFNYIISKQTQWAQRKNIKLIGSKIEKGFPAYTSNLEENLFEPLLSETKTEIDKGDGGELKGNATHAAKMCAVHSSSAIGVNIFQYRKNKRIPNLAYSLRLCRNDNNSAQEIHFEQKLKISNKFSRSPNIDVVISNNKNDKIKAFGIECKFS